MAGEDSAADAAPAGGVLGSIKGLAATPEFAAHLGWNLRAKILAEHTPAMFWRRIVDRVGVKP